MRLLNLFEDWDEEEWEPELYVLQAGTRLYHGTSEDFDERSEDLDTPFWVTTSLEVAQVYGKQQRGDKPRPRILEFETTDDLQLWLVRSREDFSDFEEHTGFELGYTASEMAASVCQHLPVDGWIIPDNYAPGENDIMLCSFEDLQFIDSRILETLIEENSVRVTDVSVNDCYRGECFGEKRLLIDDQTAVLAKINIWQDEVVIQWINTADEYARQGYATMLVDDLFREFPEKKIIISNTTEEGTGFFKQYRPDSEGRLHPRQ